MADLNALIAQGYQFQAPPDPFVQYGKRQQLELGEQTNQLNQMKMQEAQAAAVERNALRQLDPSSPDYENQLFKVNPTVGIAYRKEAATAAAQKATQEAQKAQALKTSLDNHRSFLVGVNDQPSYDAWRALTTKNIPELASMLPAEFSPDAKNLLLQTADDISKRLNPPAPAQSNLAKLRAEKAALPPGDPGHAAYDAAIAKETQFAPTAPSAPPSMVAEYTFAKTPDGGNFKGSYQDFVTTRAAAGRAPAAPRPEQPPVAVVDPVTGKQIYVSREEALRGRMTPASDATDVKPLTETQAIKRRDTVGKEFKSATSALQTTQDVLDSIAFVKAEPGLARATGFTGMLPSFPEGGAASAEVRLANLKGKVTALGKAAAAASGNIGSIATVEWKILSDQIAAIDPVKGTGPLLAQLDLVEQQAQGAMSRIRDGYERQFGEDFERFPQFSDLPPPKSAVKPKTPEAPNKPTATQGTGGFKYLGKVGGN